MKAGEHYSIARALEFAAVHTSSLFDAAQQCFNITADHCPAKPSEPQKGDGTATFAPAPSTCQAIDVAHGSRKTTQKPGLAPQQIG